MFVVCGETSTPSSHRIFARVPDPRHRRGLLDTSVVVDLDRVDVGSLPHEVTISAITLAELAAGAHATSDLEERARRQDRLQRAEAVFDPLPFHADAARTFGRVYAAVARAGRKARGQRMADLLIAATAVAAQLPLYTRNPRDFAYLEKIATIVAV
jgi:predicted nucleic acid-binding protein